MLRFVLSKAKKIVIKIDNLFKLIYEKYKLGYLKDLIFDEDYLKEINSTNTSLIDIKRYLRKESLRNKNFYKSLLITANDQYEFIKSTEIVLKGVSCIPLREVSNWVTKNGLPREVYWCTDNYDQKCKFLRMCYKEKIKVNTINNYCPTRSWNFDPMMKSSMISEANEQIKGKFAKFGHGKGLDFGYLLQLIRELSDLDGDFVEIGCFNGSSGCFMLHYLNKLIKQNNQCKNQRFLFFDVFEGFNYPEAISSGDSQWAWTHKTDGYETVKKRLKKRYSNIEVIKRNICEPNSLKECNNISFANIDVDIYEATLAGLKEVDKKLLPNGIMVVEDSGHVPNISGAYAAVEEFDETSRGKYTKINLGSAQTIFIKRN
tara:strand:+ start:3711 stop:4832 length:1122 start_codon:yes stop_codon:yes gene_type:complete